MCSIHRRVFGNSWLAGLVAFGGVLVTGCASGHLVGGATSGSKDPVIINHDEILLARRHEYRATGMMEQGVADTTVVQMLVDTLGRVVDVRVGLSSENETVDMAALRVARVHRFEPARNRGNAVAVWVSRSISFAPRLCDVPPLPDTLVMVENLGAAGRRGETTVAILVDVRGRVREAKVEVRSGWDRFDQAALRAARRTRYRPGLVNCEPGEIWTTMKYGFGRQHSGT